MSSRLDQEREARLQPKRIATAKASLEGLGYSLTFEGADRVEFEHEGHTVRFWPYSGWHSGKTIKDGRGLKRLLNQLNN